MTTNKFLNTDLTEKIEKLKKEENYLLHIDLSFLLQSEKSKDNFHIKFCFDGYEYSHQISNIKAKMMLESELFRVNQELKTLTLYKEIHI